ncbi:MAG TPA: amino acid permease, partial [Spirochaetes bacterium]|nr:amino acid permease [Spirochaetota bacterium]
DEYGKALFTEDTALRRELGLLETVSIVINRIIGSGIFRTPGPIMALVLSTSMFGAAWLIGGLITIFAAVCYAELVAMIPKSGGPYVFLRAAYPPVWSFLRGWAMFFVSETGSIAAVALVFAEYFSAMWNIIHGYPFPPLLVTGIALAVIAMLTAVNCYGVLLSGIVQDIFSFFKVIALGLVIGFCFTGPGSVLNYSSRFWPEHFSWESVIALGAALRYVFFAYSGWEGATYVAEEVRNPRKNLPLSLLIGITGVIVLYLGANMAYLYQVPVDVFKDSKWIAVDAMELAVGSIGGILISLAVMVNTFGNVSTQILCKARTWHAMARDGLFFRGFGRINPRYGTPNTSLIYQGIWASVLLLFASLSRHSYEAIIDFFTCTGVISNIMTVGSLLILRKKYPDAERPYRAWLYPWSAVIVIVFYVAFGVVTLFSAFVPSMMGLLLTSTGLLYYYRKKLPFYKRKTG